MFVQFAIHLSYHLVMDKAVCVLLDLFSLEAFAIALKVKFNQIIIVNNA